LNPSKTHWYVLTGCPCSGISTTLHALRDAGVPIVPEAARAIIDEKLARGMTISEVRRDDQAFQQEVLERKIATESTLVRHEIRVLDRGLPDSIAYHELAGLDPSEVMRICEPNLYRKVFFLEPLPWVRDYARTEDERTLKWLAEKLRAVYTNMGYPIVPVPAASVQTRVRLIRSHINASSRT